MTYYFPFVAQMGRLPIEYAASRGCVVEVEMLLPVTTPIPNAPDWSIEGVISFAKIEDKKPIVCYLLFSCCFHTEYWFRTKQLFSSSVKCVHSVCWKLLLLYA
jgi:hypothetical protein